MSGPLDQRLTALERARAPVVSTSACTALTLRRTRTPGRRGPG
jgi:hypothetical protein